MVIEKFTSNFHATYDELTREVLLAMYAFVPERLQEWFAHLDGEPEAGSAISRLESGQNFSQWFAMQGRAQRSGVPKLDWPPDNDERLGMQLLLFRSIARGDTNVGVLGKRYVPGSGQNINDNSKAFIDQIFRPMSRELIRYLRRFGLAVEEQRKEVPASDRVVSVDHNSPEYDEIVRALDKLEHTLVTVNDYPGDEEERGQRIAEVAASRSLLKAVRVRLEALTALLKPLFLQFGTKLKDTLIGAAATAVIAGLIALFGYFFG